MQTITSRASCDAKNTTDTTATTTTTASTEGPEMASCRNVKVRRNVKSLSRDEKERLVNALNKLVHNGRY